MTPFRRLTLLFGIFLFLAFRPAQAQTSFYFTPTLTDYGYASGNNNTAYKSDSGGFIVGGFYNFPIDSRLTAGIDGRVSYSFGRRGGNFETAALRIGFVPDKIRLRPYFEIGGGVVSSSPDLTALPGVARNNQRTNGAAELTFGLDIKLTDSFDLRAIELGAAAGANSSSSPSAVASFLDAGIVYHLHGRVKNP